MSEVEVGGSGRLIEIRGEAAALVVPSCGGWEVHAVDGRWAEWEGRRFRTPIEAEHAMMADRTRISSSPRKPISLAETGT